MNVTEQIENEVKAVILLIKEASTRHEKSVTVRVCGEVVAEFVRMGFTPQFFDDGRTKLSWK